jgi:hypothetical protein
MTGGRVVAENGGEIKKKITIKIKTGEKRRGAALPAAVQDAAGLREIDSI